MNYQNIFTKDVIGESCYLRLDEVDFLYYRQTDLSITHQIINCTDDEISIVPIITSEELFGTDTPFTPEENIEDSFSEGFDEIDIEAINKQGLDDEE